jgi:hypothetical protein
VPPSAGVKRAAVAAARTSSGPPGVAAAVYMPWATVLAAADSRLKAEINDALRGLQHATSLAGTLLDRATANAEAAAAPLEQAAYAEYTARMATADRVRETILDPAAKIYAEQVTAAHSRYDAAITLAEDTYKTTVADAQRAQNDAGSIVA